MGPTPGLIATQQAMEVIKVVSGVGSPLTQRLLVYDALDCTFRVMKLRPRSAACAVCGDTPSIRTLADTEAFLAAGDVPCVEACVGPRLDAEARSLSITATQLQALRERRGVDGAGAADADAGAGASFVGCSSPLVLDVREEVQFAICSLPGSVNLPLRDLGGRLDYVDTLLDGEPRDSAQVVVVCRRGVDSLVAVEVLRKEGFAGAVNLFGGLQAWHKDVDPAFPLY